MRIRTTRTVEIGRIRSILKLMENAELGDFTTYAFGSTHAPDLEKISYKLENAASMICQGSGILGLSRFTPIPKPTAFALLIHDKRTISDFFELLDQYLLITLLFMSGARWDDVDRTLTSGKHNLHELERLFCAPYLFYTFDLDSNDGESGMTQDVIVSDGITNEVRSVLALP